MDKYNINQLLANKKVVDYTYATMFLVISSFFAFFVIRPVLGVAVGLQREAKDLKELNEIYQSNIDKVLQIQSSLDTVAKDRYLLDIALPGDPDYKEIINNINFAASESGLKVSNFQLYEIEINRQENQKNVTKQIKMSLNTTGSYQQFKTFVNNVTQQRRLKTINSIKIEEIRHNADVELGEYNLTITMDIYANYINSPAKPI